MSSEISTSLGKQQSSSTPISFAKATADTVFTQYSQSASGILTSAQADTLVNGGVATAIADGKAVFSNDPSFSALFNQSTAIGSGSNFKAKSSSETKVAASFSVAANQSFSFNFAAALGLIVNEIKDSQGGSNEAKSKTAFLVLDTSNVNKPRVLDYFGYTGDLSSPKETENLKFSSSKGVQVGKPFESKQDLNNAETLTGIASGTYQRKFNGATNITLVEINDTSAIVSSGNNKDALTGKSANSLLAGDTASVSSAATLAGQTDGDTFTFKKDDSQPAKYEINNFDVGKDRVEIQGLGSIDASSWYKGITSANQLVDTPNGATLTVTPGENIVFKGVSTNQLSSSNFLLS